MVVKNRNIGLDVFRIVLALMVIILHINAGGTGMVLKYATDSPWKYIVSFMTTLCFPAVNCYVIMSAYYMSKQEKDIFAVVKALAKLWLSVAFFALAGYLSVCVIKGEFNAIELVKRFFSVSRGSWWYITVYFVLVLLSPFLNIVIRNINKKDYKILLTVLLIVCSVVPMFLKWQGQIGSNYGYSIIWFITLYFTGAYLRYYKYDNVVLNNRIFIKCIALYLLVSAISACIGPISSKLGYLIDLGPYNSIATYTQAILLFVAFLHMNIKSVLGKPISFIAGLSLASYLLHCQEDVESVLWSFTKPYEYANSSKVIIVWLVMTAGIYIVAVVLEFLRKKIVCVTGFEKWFSELVTKLAKKVTKYNE